MISLAILCSTSCASKKEVVRVQNSRQPVHAAKPPRERFSLLGAFSKISQIIPRKSKPPAATTPLWAGAIRMVNTQEKFVLIESHSISSIIPGETYLAIAKGRETASLRMTSLRNPPFFIADILNGNPTVGEKIYLPRSVTEVTQSQASAVP